MLKTLRAGGKSGQPSKGGKESRNNEKDQRRGGGKSGQTSTGGSTTSSALKKEMWMYAVVVEGGTGGAEALQVQLVPRPFPKANEVLIKVEFSGVNGPDIHQRETALAPDDDMSPYLGLECSGTIYEHGVGMSKEEKKAWPIGNMVCAITNGGSYAQYVAVPVAHLLPIPSKTLLQEAATFPQAACTVWSELFMTEMLSDAMKSSGAEGVRLSPGQTLLIHGGSSGIGTFAIQMAKRKGVTVFVTAGSDEKLKACKELGADVCINYNESRFEKVVLDKTEGKGVDAILDCRGKEYYVRNCSCLSSGGWIVTIGPSCNNAGQDSYKFDLGRHLVEVCALRHRTSEMKAAIVKEVRKNVWPAIEARQVKAYENKIKPFAFKNAAEAHKLKEEGNFAGKILLYPGKLP